MNAQLIDELTRFLGDRFTVNDYERQQHGQDESALQPMLPDAVCFPLSTEEVAEIARVCQKHQTPVIPFGAGSSLEGHVFAPHGGVNESFLTAPIVGHVGDGNFHLLLLVDPAKPEELAEAERLNERLVERALEMGGMITGEHGVGWER
jgi:FAD/FMN-containing dehydrogenase